MTFLPGWHPAPGKQLLRSISLISRTYGLGATVAAPADIRFGDLLLFFNSADGYSSNNGTIPAGFTSINQDNDSGTDYQFNSSYKLAAGSEGGTNITGLAAGISLARTALVVFRGNIPFRSASVGGLQQESIGGGNPGNQAVNTAGASVPFIDVGWGYSSGDLTDVDMPNALTNGADDRMVTGYTLHNTIGVGGGGYNIGNGGAINALYSWYMNLTG